MSQSIDTYYWDTCIFYEYLKDERPGTPDRQRIDAILADNKALRNRICTSVITHTEFLPKKITDPEAEKRYLAQFGSLYFFDIEADRQVISLARHIRDFYFVAPTDSSRMKIMQLGDAIHVATAIIHNVTEMHTRDKKSKGTAIPLLGLPEASPNGKICGVYDLKIVSPTLTQPNLPGIVK